MLGIDNTMYKQAYEVLLIVLITAYLIVMVRWLVRPTRLKWVAVVSALIIAYLHATSIGFALFRQMSASMFEYYIGETAMIAMFTLAAWLIARDKRPAGNS